MAQFSSLEQMKNVASAVQKMEAKQNYAVVGKIVSGPDLVTGEDVVGVASGIFFEGEGKSYVRVNGRMVDLSQLNFISDPSLFREENSARGDIRTEYPGKQSFGSEYKE
jgi:flagellar basal-body rod modification protein FlgD